MPLKEVISLLKSVATIAAMCTYVRRDTHEHRHKLGNWRRVLSRASYKWTFNEEKKHLRADREDGAFGKYVNTFFAQR